MDQESKKEPSLPTKPSPSRLLWPLTFAFLAIGLALVWFGTRKTICLVVGNNTAGQVCPASGQWITTHAWKVRGVLQAAGVLMGEADRLEPPADTWLKGGMVLRLERAVAVQILADGQIYNLLTVERIPANLLAMAHISLYPGDVILAGGQPISPELPLPAVLPLQVRRSQTFQLQEGDQTKELSSNASTLGQALWEQGIFLLPGDRLEPSPETPLTTGLKAVLKRSRWITIQTTQAEIRISTTAVNVAEALTDAGLSLQGLDYVQPDENSPLPDNGFIRLVRVRETVAVEQTPIPFETSYQPAADLELDRQTILQPGVYGFQAQRVRVRYEDDQEVSRQVEDQWIASQPQERVIGFGTKVVQYTADTPDGTITYWRALQMYATSYYPAATGSNITSTGQVLKKGLVAVNPNYIPYGTQLYIPGYGEAVAADTGRLGPRSIDLGFSDNDYVAWHKTVTVYFLWPPPANIVWIIP